MMKKTIAILLALVMVLGLAVACAKPATEAPKTEEAPKATEAPKAEEKPAATEEPLEPAKEYTYNTYSTSLGNNWNPHTWETSADDSIRSYLSMPFVTMQAKDTENGVYQWIYEMATEINDVTASHKDDLAKYPVNLPQDKTADEVDAGYVFEIKLNPNAKWQDGTPINADTYIYSMKQLLDPEMKNYRANLYYAGESAIAGGNGYYNADQAGQEYYVNAAGTDDTELYLDLTKVSYFFGEYSAKDYYDAGYADYFMYTPPAEEAAAEPAAEEAAAEPAAEEAAAEPAAEEAAAEPAAEEAAAEPAAEEAAAEPVAEATEAAEAVAEVAAEATEAATEAVEAAEEAAVEAAAEATEAAEEAVAEAAAEATEAAAETAEAAAEETAEPTEQPAETPAAIDLYAKLTAVEGYQLVNDDIIADLLIIASNFGDNNPEAWKEFCFVKRIYEAVDWDHVGLYKTDDYTIYYVMENQIDYNYALTSFTDNWLVYEPLYEAGKDTTGTLVTTNYGTSVETSMSYGVYKLESLQEDKQMVFTQNENWYGWEKQPNGALLSYTPYEVDGAKQQRYQTTKIIIDVMDDDAGKQAFLKGEMMEWAPTAEDLPTYAASEQLYKADETYSMSFFFNTDPEALKEMDNSKGNTNSVVLSNTTFRRAFSFAIDRAEWVTATPGYKPTFGLLNTLYYYDVYNNPESMYRTTNQAMQAICDLYEVKYGEGTPYATLEDAYKSINGYNLTMAKELMAQACKELVEAGLYTEGEEIKIRVGYKKGALDSADNKQVELMNKYINAAVEGSGFGKITLEAVGNINDRYGAVPAGEFAIGYGAWGGAAFYPFRNLQVYCDPDQYDINEAADWDPKTETLTLNLNGEDVTMTWQEWSNCMVGTGAYANADFDTKLDILSAMEKQYLEKYYRIPLATSTTCVLVSYKAGYFTSEYNIMYGWGGLELMKYNYDDVEWAAFVASQNGALNYE